jgi:hypothetical protein
MGLNVTHIFQMFVSAMYEECFFIGCTEYMLAPLLLPKIGSGHGAADLIEMRYMNL